MIITCDCGQERHIHKTYMPDEGETVLIVCGVCKKEYEIHCDRSGFHLQEKEPAPYTGGQRGEF